MKGDLKSMTISVFVTDMTSVNIGVTYHVTDHTVSVNPS